MLFDFLLSGVPKLKRSEIETACEEFSNVIGSCPIGTLFKGTLSSGVEVAVASVATASAKEWTNNIETQFRKKLPYRQPVHFLFPKKSFYCHHLNPLCFLIISD